MCWKATGNGGVCGRRRSHPKRAVLLAVTLTGACGSQWREYKDRDSRYSVSMPGPVAEVQGLRVGGSEPVGAVRAEMAGGGDHYVFSIEGYRCPTPCGTAVGVSANLDAVRAEVLRDEQVVVVSERPVPEGGREMILDVRGRTVRVERVYVHSGRIFEVRASMGHEAHRAAADRFLSSFRFTD